MKAKWHGARRATLWKCAACRGHVVEWDVRRYRLPAGGEPVVLCVRCWNDCLSAHHHGGHDLDALVEQVVAAASSA